ncbi:MAG: hypothetical protein QOF96_2867 [Actinomycetota bacterium]|nr:hypothetical protein [Actinomycetota bacterium]
MARITINGVSLDPLVQSDRLKEASAESLPPSGSDYVLIQTSAPLSDEQKAQLTDLGVVVQEYVPDDTYLCRYPHADLGAIRALPFVAWADVYFP